METGLDKQRFLKAWSDCAKGTNDSGYAESIFDELNSLYYQASRVYHTGRHIIHCLTQYDLSRDINGPLANVELAIWMHDAIYEPGSRINEARSAQWFREKARSHMDDVTIDTIANLILITQHKVLPKTYEEQCIVDIDLSSFGMQWDDFYSDGLRIRQEFKHQDDEKFTTSQITFMQALLERQKIYTTPFFHELLEERARKNIQGQIAQHQSSHS